MKFLVVFLFLLSNVVFAQKAFFDKILSDSATISEIVIARDVKGYKPKKEVTEFDKSVMEVFITFKFKGDGSTLHAKYNNELIEPYIEPFGDRGYFRIERPDEGWLSSKNIVRIYSGKKFLDDCTFTIKGIKDSDSIDLPISDTPSSSPTVPPASGGDTGGSANKPLSQITLQDLVNAKKVYVIFKDGNKSNTSLDNLEIIPASNVAE